MSGGLAVVVVQACLAAALLSLVGGFLLRLRMWRRGRPALSEGLVGILRAPGRYLRDVHDVVERDRATAGMHMAAAGGFVASVILLTVRYGTCLGGRWTDAALGAALVVLAGGAVADLLRRRLHAKSRTGQLSTGPWSRFPLWLLGCASGLGAFHGAHAYGGDSAPPGLGLAGAVLGGACLVALIAPAAFRGSLRHGLAGLLNLAFHSRPERFEKKAGATALRPASPDAEKIGVETPSDFQWNQLLSFDACVQCGRCEVACPAFAAGQPLNPKKFIQDLVTGMSGPGDDRRYHGRGHPGLPVGERRGAPDAPIVGDLVDPATLWACTTCRACVEECPMMIEHVDAMVDLRRFEVSEAARTPPAAAGVLENLRQTDTRSGRELGARYEWAADLKLPRASESEPVDVLLWAGESAFDLRGQRTLRALVKLLRAAGVDFAVLGDEEADVGDLARRLGDELTFHRLMAQNCRTLQRYQFERIVTADPHVLHTLGAEYASYGARFEVVHHTTFLVRLIETGRLQLQPGGRGAVTYHDPCYLGRYSGEFDAPRAVLEALGVELREMTRSGRRARCCGGGGGAPVVDVPGERRIPDMRMDDARETGSAVVAVACPQCALMLEGVVEPRPRVADIAELLADRVLETGR